MAIPIVPLVTAGAGLAGQLINNGAQRRLNRETQQFSLDMYNRQFSDNQKMWHMQNEYNDPKSQMARLAGAGLNPNLVYGNGNAIQPASTPKEANAPTWSPNAPRIDLGSVTSQYFDASLKQAQLDNLKATNTDILNSALLKVYQMKNLESSTEATGLSNKFKLETWTNSAQVISEQLRKLSAEAGISERDEAYAEGFNYQKSNLNELQIRKLEGDLREQATRMRGMSQDQVLKAMDIELRKNGINPNDPIYMRIIGRIIAKKFNISNLF